MSLEIDNEIKALLIYIGVDEDNPNMGTKAKRNLTTKVLRFCIESSEGKYSAWVGLLSMRLNMSTRTLKENYFEPLIDIGVLDKGNNTIKYIGIPKSKEEELKDLDKAVEEAKERRKKG